MYGKVNSYLHLAVGSSHRSQSQVGSRWYQMDTVIFHQDRQHQLGQALSWAWQTSFPSRGYLVCPWCNDPWLSYMCSLGDSSVSGPYSTQPVETSVSATFNASKEQYIRDVGVVFPLSFSANGDRKCWCCFSIEAFGRNVIFEARLLKYLSNLHGICQDKCCLELRNLEWTFNFS